MPLDSTPTPSQPDQPSPADGDPTGYLSMTWGTLTPTPRMADFSWTEVDRLISRVVGPSPFRAFLDPANPEEAPVPAAIPLPRGVSVTRTVPPGRTMMYEACPICDLSGWECRCYRCPGCRGPVGCNCGMCRCRRCLNGDTGMTLTPSRADGWWPPIAPVPPRQFTPSVPRIPAPAPARPRRASNPDEDPLDDEDSDQDGPDLALKDRPLQFFPAPETDYKPWVSGVRLPRRYVSVEIEVAGLDKRDQNWRVRKACEKWSCSVVHDGSLPDSGFEINTSPAKGLFFQTQITELCKALRSAQAAVDKSCGLHVHVDCRDLSSAQILRLIEVYGRIEDALFLVVPDSRRRNAEYSASGKDYCAKCAVKLRQAMEKYLRKPDDSIYWGADPKDRRAQDKGRAKAKTRRLLQMAVYEGQGRRTLRDPYVTTTERKRSLEAHLRSNTGSRWSDARYYALNLHPYFYTGDGEQAPIPGRLNRHGRQMFRRLKRGTIECRLAAGTTDPEKIINWARLWDQIVYAATGWPTARLQALPKDPFEALLAVADDEVLAKWLVGRKEKFAGHAPPPVEDF